MSVVCCQVEVSATGRSPVQRAVPSVVRLSVTEGLPSNERRIFFMYLSTKLLQSVGRHSVIVLTVTK